MFAAHLGLTLAGHIGGANARNLVCGNRHADSAATNENPQVGALTADVFAHPAGIIRIAQAVTGIRAVVIPFKAFTLQVQLDFVFQFVTGMIGAQRNSHAAILRRRERRVSRNRGMSRALAFRNLFPASFHRIIARVELSRKRCLWLPGRPAILSLSPRITSTSTLSAQILWRGLR